MAEPYGTGDQRDLPATSEVYVVDPISGKRGVISRADLDTYEEHGYVLEKPEATYEAKMEREYGDQAGQAFLHGIGSAATLGTLDIALGKWDPKGTREIRARSPWAFAGGNIVGAVATGGMGPAAGLSNAAKAAEGIAVAGKAGLGAKVGGAVVRGAVEGGGYGVGTAVSEMALQEEPLTIEGAASTLSSHVLMGAGGGAVLSGTGKLLGEGAKAVKAKAVQELDTIAAGSKGGVDRSKYPEYANMDQGQLAKAAEEQVVLIKADKAKAIEQGTLEHKAELARIEAEKKAATEQFYYKARDYKDEVKAAKNFVVTGDNETKAQLAASSNRLKKGLDNKKGVVDSSGRKGQYQAGLETQDTVFSKVLESSDKVRAEAAEHVDDVLESLPQRKIPMRDALDPLGPTPMEVTANDLQRAGLFEMKGGGEDPIRMLHAAKYLENPEKWDDPIKLIVDEKGQVYIDNGRHRLRAALEEGGERKIPVIFDQAVEGLDVAAAPDVVQLGASGVYLKPEQADLFRAWRGRRPTGRSLAISEEKLVQFTNAIEAGQVKPHSVQQIERVEKLLQKNRALQEELAGLQAKPNSSKLEEIALRLKQVENNTTPTPRLDSIKAEQASRQTKTLGHGIAQGLGGLIGGSVGGSLLGPAGSVAGAFVGRDMAIKIYERLFRKIAAGNVQRTQVIKKAVANLFVKGAGGVAKAMPHASKIIPAITYNHPDRVDAILGPSNYAPSKDPTVDAFRQRSRELDSLTEKAPDGTYKMRMRAKEELHERMGLLWSMSAGMANGIEKLQAVKVEFLASKIPRNPTPPHLQLGPDTWEPSHAQMSQYARIQEVTEFPEKAAERLGEGTATPDDIETLKTVYPAHYDDIRQQCFEHAATLQTTMPYQKRLSLGILLDVPVDPALTQQALSVYQAPKPQQQQPQAPQKALPQGMVQATQSQRMSSK
jgi:hypothetical protein